MTPSRLSLALETGGPLLPETGAIAVFRPRAGTDLSALPKPRVHVVQGFRPDHDAFAAEGFRVSPEGGAPCAIAVVCVPRAKAEARGLIAEASRVTGGSTVVVDGQKSDGIEGLLKACRARVEIGGVVTKAHGKLFWFAGGDFADWAMPGPARNADGFVTVPGVFSADGIDPGSALLAAALPARMPATVADLGAGWGYLSHAVLARPGVATLHVVEAEHAALACARRNLDDPRAVFHWADATRFHPPDPLDAVVTNPPFHVGRAGDPGLGRAFIARAAAILKPSGRFWLVANRHLPYEAAVREHFAETRELPGTPAFKLIEAARPRRARR